MNKYINNEQSRIEFKLEEYSKYFLDVIDSIINIKDKILTQKDIDLIMKKIDDCKIFINGDIKTIENNKWIVLNKLGGIYIRLCEIIETDILQYGNISSSKLDGLIKLKDSIIKDYKNSILS